ncbi:helix-turn-helix domain-containing protein [Actinocorallia sp. API 0066]|uniref:helix-turn-helix domain-containing protein n=1 Tax=Actinocorallia sp. API 0066 TaxID=2896846 RepID=UPI001E60451B|nr:helix-turn-helix domain-containing protein [Actinocorallia sp. API 0066]MCD0451907.1 helix-turn-helix domain-containing protein [Actinocorallia sp. API 0066]
MVSWRPGPGLRPYLGPVYGYRQDGGAPGVHRGVASPWLTVILTWDEPLRLAEGAGTQGYGDLVGGLHLAPETIVHDGRQCGIQVALHPRGALALLGVPAGELAFRNVAGGDVLPGLGELRERLGGATGWAERFTLLERFLLARLDGRPRGRPVLRDEIAQGWRRVLETGGAVGVAELAAETGWSERYLRRGFVEQVGMPPGTLGRVVRFDTARSALRARAVRGEPLRLAELAHATGYTDQAHLSREFRAFTGLPPLRYVRAEFLDEAFRFVQDDDGAAGEE